MELHSYFEELDKICIHMNKVVDERTKKRAKTKKLPPYSSPLEMIAVLHTYDL